MLKNNLQQFTDLKLRKINLRTIEDLIMDEHLKQISKWGVQTHTAWEWITYTNEEMGEVNKSLSEWIYRNGTKEDLLKEIIQTVTLLLKMYEMIDNFVYVEEILITKNKTNLSQEIIQ